MAFAANTTVPLERSISEIIGMLRKAGAESIGQMHERDSFIVVFALGDRRMKFKVPLVTAYKGPAVARNGVRFDPTVQIEQQNRQKGRALMLVVKAKLESVESGVETFEQAFLANIMLAGGQTVYENIAEPIALEYQTGRAGPLLLTGG